MTKKLGDKTSSSRRNLPRDVKEETSLLRRKERLRLTTLTPESNSSKINWIKIES